MLVFTTKQFRFPKPTNRNYVLSSPSQSLSSSLVRVNTKICKINQNLQLFSKQKRINTFCTLNNKNQMNNKDNNERIDKAEEIKNEITNEGNNKIEDMIMKGTCTGSSAAEKPVFPPNTGNINNNMNANNEEMIMKMITENYNSLTTVEKIKYWMDGYASLSKFKLSALVLSTSMLGYFMAPGPFSFTAFTVSTFGVGATICAANSINQIIEVNNDSRMNRTKKRWLPTQRISVFHAKCFAAVCASSGFFSLYYLVNPLSSYLALFNLFLYTAVYTPMKQKHPMNTWVGAVVGAIPPMIGWAADTAGMEMGSWVLAAMLGFWQMPHFMALSYSLKDDYHRGGFKMLINTNPERVKRVILDYSIAMIPIGYLSYLSGMTSIAFAFDSLIPNFVLLYYAKQFYDNPSKESALKIFKFSLLLLPLLMALMLIHKINDDDDKNEEDRTAVVLEEPSNQTVASN